MFNNYTKLKLSTVRRLLELHPKYGYTSRPGDGRARYVFTDDVNNVFNNARNALAAVYPNACFYGCEHNGYINVVIDDENYNVVARKTFDTLEDAAAFAYSYK